MTVALSILLAVLLCCSIVMTILYFIKKRDFDKILDIALKLDDSNENYERQIELYKEIVSMNEMKKKFYENKERDGF